MIRGLAVAEALGRLLPQRRGAGGGVRPAGPPRPAEGLRGQLRGHPGPGPRVPAQIPLHPEPRVRGRHSTDMDWWTKIVQILISLHSEANISICSQSVLLALFISYNLISLFTYSTPHTPPVASASLH